MQPFSQDPIDPTGQPAPYPQPVQSSAPPPMPNYPPGEEGYYNRISQVGAPVAQYPAGPQGKSNAPSKPGSGWKVVSLVLFILVLVLATATTTLYLTRPSGSTPGTVVLTSTATSVGQQPTQVVQPTPTLPTSANYSAVQPGPGCDTNKGTWTVQGLNQIQCASGGTTISSDSNSLGYLYLQLPNDATFSSTNKISIMGSGLGYDDGYVCLGLAEQGTNTGVLGEFCGNGGWFIYSLSSTGVLTQMLNQGITSVRANEEISLTLQSNMVLFSIDTETYKATISSIQPVKVAITSYNQTSNNGNTISITNFSYLTQPD